MSTIPETMPETDLRQLLRDVRRARERRSQLDRYTEEMRIMLHSANLERTRVTGSSSLNPVEERLACLMDANERLHRQLDRVLVLSRRTERIFRMIPDPRLSILLHMRYLEDLEWRVIASQLKVSLRWVHVLHREAMLQLEEIVRAHPELLTEVPLPPDDTE